MDGSFWAFLDPAPRPAAQTPGRSGLRLALSVGVGLGVVCWVVCLLPSLQYRALPHGVADPPEAKLQFYFTLVVVSVVLEVAAAAVVAWRAPALKAAHGLLSAFVTACLASAGIHILILVVGGSFNLQTLSTTLSLVVVLGGCMAMVAAGIAGAFGKRVAVASVTQTWLAVEPFAQLEPGASTS